MNPAPYHEESLFQAALRLSGSHRGLFLDGACASDSALRQRLEALLAVLDATDSLMADPTEEDRPVLARLSEAPGGMTIGRYKLLEKVGRGRLRGGRFRLAN